VICNARLRTSANRNGNTHSPGHEPPFVLSQVWRPHGDHREINSRSNPTALSTHGVDGCSMKSLSHFEKFAHSAALRRVVGDPQIEPQALFNGVAGFPPISLADLLVGDQRLIQNVASRRYRSETPCRWSGCFSNSGRLVILCSKNQCPRRRWVLSHHCQGVAAGRFNGCQGWPGAPRRGEKDACLLKKGAE
jgi:hypothetical protein